VIAVDACDGRRIGFGTAAVGGRGREERKRLLKQMLPRAKLLHYSEHIKEEGIALFEKAKQAGFEGAMAKLASGLYYSGKRTREWRKFKAMNENRRSSSSAIALRGVRANTSGPSCSRYVNPRIGGTSGTRERVWTKRRFECATT
jgi:hypothetical protein